MRAWRATRDVLTGKAEFEHLKNCVNEATVDACDARGCTPTMLACIDGAPEVLQLLIEVSARLLAQSSVSCLHVGQSHAKPDFSERRHRPISRCARLP